MADARLMQRIYTDMEFLKSQIAEIKLEITEINLDLHRVRPDYARKIRKIEERGKFRAFSDVKEIRREIEHV